MIVFSIICFFSILSILEVRGEDDVIGGGKCGSPERCCTGRDSSCFVNSGDGSVGGSSYFGNSIISHPCYCDEGCLETGDCCSDYEEVCSYEGKP